MASQYSWHYGTLQVKKTTSVSVHLPTHKLMSSLSPSLSRVRTPYITSQLNGGPTYSIQELTRLLIRKCRHPEVLERCPGVPIILVGLKKDLRDDPVAQEEMRKRSEKFLIPDEGEDVRKRIGAKKYLECSSLTGEGVDDVFEAATRQSLLSGDRKERGGCCVIL